MYRNKDIKTGQMIDRLSQGYNWHGEISLIDMVCERLEDQQRMIFLMREFYQFYVTQTELGASHHHEIWQDIACLLQDEDPYKYNRPMTKEEHQYITGPHWASHRIREQNEDLFEEKEE